MSTEKKPKKYVKGSAKQINFAGENHLINVDLLLSDLQKLKVSPAGYIKITLSKYKEKDQYGNTHSIYENDFVPDLTLKKDKMEEIKVASNGALKKRPNDHLDNLPF